MGAPQRVMPPTEPLYKKGDTIEDYKVLEAIGQGAASFIYLVQDPRTKQIRALKHVHRETEKDDRFIEQALYEATVASKLNHPNIRKIERVIKKTKRFVQVTDAFLVMEYLDGPSMDTHPPRTFEDALVIFRQTAQGLAHMHERGFVHADMKPHNVIVTRGPESEPGPVAKIIDLGQSCRVGTVKPRMQGTPDYIAPEQVHRRPITPKTDIYNLGATIYWTLTRQNVPTALPKGDSLVSKLDDALIPRAKPAIEINDKIPVKLNELVMQCVEVDPDKRPDAMSFVADKLDLILGVLRAKAAEAKKQGSGAPVRKEGSGVGMIHTNGNGNGVKLGNPNDSTAVGVRVTNASRHHNAD